MTDSKQAYIQEEDFLAKCNMACSGVFIVIVLIVLVKTCRGSKHTFFLRIIAFELTGLFLIECREASFLIAVSTSDGFEDDPDGVRAFTFLHAFLSSIAALCFLSVRWVFCLKYLIIATEMPGLFKGEVANFESTGRYKCSQVLIWIFFCSVTAWNMFTTYFWLMEVYEGHPERNKTLAYNFVFSYLAANLILPMIPMSIFGIALRKVKKFADTSEDQTLAMNQ